MWRELWAVLIDVMHEGDLWGHLVAWLDVVRGRVTPEDRVTITAEGREVAK